MPSVTDHTTVCEAYWSSLAAGRPGDYAAYVAAQRELAGSGPAVLPWARGLLGHAEHEARALGAFLLGKLGERGLLGEAAPAVVGELGALALRPPLRDGKELEVNDTAVMALGMIGGDAVVPHLRAVIESTEAWAERDVKWGAAIALGKVAGVAFGQAPVAEALEWLRARPVR